MLCSVNVWITIHLGKNPKKGGRPPSERRKSIVENFNQGFLLSVKNLWLIWKICDELKVKIKHEDKNEYIRK